MNIRRNIEQDESVIVCVHIEGNMVHIYVTFYGTKFNDHFNNIKNCNIIQPKQSQNGGSRTAHEECRSKDFNLNG